MIALISKLAGQPAKGNELEKTIRENTEVTINGPTETS